jgi:hypothetical protein
MFMNNQLFQQLPYHIRSNKISGVLPDNSGTCCKKVKIIGELPEDGLKVFHAKPGYASVCITRYIVLVVFLREFRRISRGLFNIFPARNRLDQCLNPQVHLSLKMPDIQTMNQIICS